MIADVPEVDLGDYQRTARLLLVHGLVTERHPDPQALGSVRKWATQLQRDLQTVAGYRLELRPRAARLVRVLDVADAVHGARAAQPFDRDRYAVLALVLAALERLAAQVTLTELSRAVRTAASNIEGLAFDPERHGARRAFTAVVEWLEDRGVLTLTDGSRNAWEQQDPDGEALYDIDREVARMLFVPPHPIATLGSTRRLLGEAHTGLSPEAERTRRRRSLARRLLDDPVVYFADLDDDLASYGRHEGRAIGAELERLTGCRLERRSEGLALLATGGRFADEPFPRPGADAQVALLLIDAIAGSLRGRSPEYVTWPGVGSDELEAALDFALPDAARIDASALAQRTTSTVKASGAQVPLVTETWLEDACATIARTHVDHLKAAHHDPAQLREDGVTVLARVGLVRRVPGGLAVMPALARYRDVRVKKPSATALATLVKEPA